eukprot:jgi/Mesvir1/23811/Mv10623-RA.2
MGNPMAPLARDAAPSGALGASSAPTAPATATVVAAPTTATTVAVVATAELATAKTVTAVTASATGGAAATATNAATTSTAATTVTPMETASPNPAVAVTSAAPATPTPTMPAVRASPSPTAAVPYREPNVERMASPRAATTPAPAPAPAPATALPPRDPGGASEAPPGADPAAAGPGTSTPKEDVTAASTPHEGGEGKGVASGGPPKRSSSVLRERDKEGHGHGQGHGSTPPGGSGPVKLAIRNSKISHYFMPAHAMDEDKDKDKAKAAGGHHHHHQQQQQQQQQRESSSPPVRRTLMVRSSSQKASDNDGSHSRSGSEEGAGDAHSGGSHPAREGNPGTVSSKGSQERAGKANAGLVSEIERLKRWLAASEEACANLQRGKDQLQGDLAALGKSVEQLTRDKEAMAEELQQNVEMEKMKDGRISKLSHAVAEYAVAVAKLERASCRERVRADSLRLGTIGVIMTGTSLSEVWEEGHAVLELQEKMIDLVKQRERVERRRKENKKLLAALPETPPPSTSGAEQSSQPSLQELLASEEAYKAKLASIKREEESLAREKERMDVLKLRHLRELKRTKEEDASRFNKFGILHKRYVLLNLLGKGGFSEVYKAYDVVELTERACKIHQLNSTWSEAKKQSYLRHAMREYQIHKAVAHPNVVQLFDIFQIDENTFATILEYCEGMDLDAHLKANPTLPEKEARAILVQIFAGLAYLNHPSHVHRVIHYDLKPGNILFDAVGEVKITDFGLSKVIEEQGVDCMELTSQGAGTYWYLPPECFEIGKGPPKISSKVDVWSAGVIFFQMLFGRRPFGHELSQENILRENVIRRANKVEFPAKPAVSAEAKEFIQLCLTHNQADRPDVLTIVQHPYLSLVQKTSAGGRRSSAPPT